LHRLFVDAMNRHIDAIEVILRVYQGLPFVNESAVLECGDPDLTDSLELAVSTSTATKFT
jgi:hypothetical protein